MVLPVATAIVAFVWLVFTYVPAAAAFPTQGSATWIGPSAGAVVVECYPLSIQFTSPVAPRNISFWYYVGAQTLEDQTIVPITSWPKSMWVGPSTLYSAPVASVPIAAGTTMALYVANYDNSVSYLHQIVIQPNTDESCITSAYQRGISHYNSFAELPATTTVSPATLSSTGAPAVTSVSAAENVFPTQGSAIWIAPGAGPVVAECYPLSIQFTSPVPTRNISFLYYGGAQTLEGQTIVPITSWPKSMWVGPSTLYSAPVASVPIAAGTMMALYVANYDNSVSYLHQIVIQPNTDESCITSAYQHGISQYNSFVELPATTTVSPTTISSMSSSDASSSSATSTSSAERSVTPSSTPTSAVTTHKKSEAGIIAGATIAALVGLALAAAAGAWFIRRQLARRADKRWTLIAEPYVPAPPPRRTIQEVDGGPMQEEPERLPPQYADISGSSGAQSPNSTVVSGRSAKQSSPGSSLPSRTKT